MSGSHNLLTTIIGLVVTAAVIAGFLWLAVRLISRMTGEQEKSPPGSEPTDRTDDEERQVW